MLNITTNSDATQLFLSHTNFGTNLESLSLKLWLGCENTPTEVNLISQVPLISEGTLVLAPEHIFTSNTPERFPDGIYNFEVKFRHPVAEYTYERTTKNCFFIDYDLKCKLDLCDKVKVRLYRALLYGNDCDSCDCAKMCEIYNILINKISNTNAGDCGCN